MIIKFLGTGTSTGVPEIGCKCEVCTSTDPRDKRLRSSVLIRTEDLQLLIDCGPDFRQQLIPETFHQMDGVLITHEHYDHTGGIDDLRPFCEFGAVNIYLEKNVAEAIETRMPYCFRQSAWQGIPIINLNTIGLENPFYIENLKITPIRAIHGMLPIFGYRIGNFAYMTDVKTIPDSEYAKLENIDTLVINALRFEPHRTHESVGEALEVVKRIDPKRAFFTHMSHKIGLHRVIEKMLPENIQFAYDGLIIESE